MWAKSALVLAGLLGVASANAADAGPTPPGLWIGQSGAGYDEPAPVLDTNVSMRITGMVARVTVRQRFANPSQLWAEGIYVFPLPEDAAVDQLRMEIGERRIEGRIQPRAEARATYAKARVEGRRTSLVEQQRPNVFTTSLANIAPGESIVVEIAYQQTVAWNDGVYSVTLPLVVAPRSSTGADIVEAPVGEGAVNPVRIEIDLHPGVSLARLESPWHPVRITSQGEHYRVRLAQSSIPADRDFELRWVPVDSALPRAALFTETVDDETYGLLMLSPPQLDAGYAQSAPREVILVIDTSGSMQGISMQQARSALEYALARLDPGDSFNVIQFNSVPRSLFPRARPVTPYNLARARSYIRDLEADGGTEILPALQRALDAGASSDRLRQVVFVTDGAVADEDEAFDLVQRQLGNSRLFMVSIGSAPNRFLMTRAARIGRGTFTVIHDVSEGKQRMAALFDKIEHPALTGLSMTWDTGEAIDAWPSPIPDLYRGEPLLVAVKGAGSSRSVFLTGQKGGSPWQAEVAVEAVQPGSGIAKLWARRKIASLMERRHRTVTKPERDALQNQVEQVALDHHLVSRYTSLVAVDITPARAGGAMQRHRLKANRPHGWEVGLVLGMAQTATSATLQWIIGTLLLIIGGIGWRRLERERRAQGESLPYF